EGPSSTVRKQALKNGQNCVWATAQAVKNWRHDRELLWVTVRDSFEKSFRAGGLKMKQVKFWVF
ncbi:MAG: hypothetical protein LBU69_03615, partial [Deltaproteobacteria bacterium]|nr:hypothetical protein [Deltaproteobacteria bacterium]